MNWKIKNNFGWIGAFIVCMVCIGSPNPIFRYIGAIGLIYICAK